jgi:DNA primase
MISDEVIRLLKQRLTADVVLELIAYPISRPKIKGSELRDVCPVHDGADGPENLAINLKTGEWFCHSKGCKRGDLISLYMQAKKMDFLTAVRELAAYLGISTEERICYLGYKGSNLSTSDASGLPIKQKEVDQRTEKMEKSKSIAEKGVGSGKKRKRTCLFREERD